jgi:hypothetical protein
MLKRPISVSVLAAALAVSAGPLFAADQVRDRTQDQTQAQDQERIYGSQLMTQKERNAYRARMRAAKTVEEREKIRNEHHALMQQRAKERGVTLPDMPPAGGGMMRPGGGMGGGMGPGGGMRQGGGY